MKTTQELNPIYSYEEVGKVSLLTDGKKRRKITIADLFSFLVTKKYIPQNEYIEKSIYCTTSTDGNDIVVAKVDNTDMYIDLAGALIEVAGYISKDEKSGNFSIKITTGAKSDDPLCEQSVRSVFTYRSCKKALWTKELSSIDVCRNATFETMLGQVKLLETENPNAVVSVDTLNSLIKIINKVLMGQHEEFTESINKVNSVISQFDGYDEIVYGSSGSSGNSTK